jgi:hypothetical protein
MAETSDVAEYRQAAALVRDNAKWLLRSLGVTGGLLVTGLGLSSLAQLHNFSYLALAIGGLALALAGVAFAIMRTATVLTPSTVTMARIVDAEERYARNKPIPNYMKLLMPLADSGIVLPAEIKTYSQLSDKWRGAQQASEEADQLGRDEVTAEHSAAAELAYRESETYNQIVAGIVARAAYHEIADRAHQRGLAASSAVVVLGVVAFAVALALPSLNAKATVDCAAYYLQLDSLADDEPAVVSHLPNTVFPLDVKARTCGFTSSRQLDGFIAYLGRR